MSHITIIISKSSPMIVEGDSTPEVAFTYSIPVPHDATPTRVGEMVRQAYRHLQMADSYVPDSE